MNELNEERVILNLDTYDKMKQELTDKENYISTLEKENIIIIKHWIQTEYDAERTLEIDRYFSMEGPDKNIEDIEEIKYLMDHVIGDIEQEHRKEVQELKVEIEELKKTLIGLNLKQVLVVNKKKWFSKLFRRK